MRLAPQSVTSYSILMDSSTVEIISERLDQLEREIARQELVVRALREERDEILVAMRVIKRFAGGGSEVLRPDKATEGLLGGVPSSTTRQGDQPAEDKDEKLTTPEMILRVLKANGGVMQAKDILAEVRKLYWADAPSSSVGPTAWRMWKERRLAKVEDGYALPNEERPAGETAGPSERRGAAGDGTLL